MLDNKRVFAEINLSNIAENVVNIKKSLDKNTKLMTIVKAYGYGHGALEVAKICIENGADWLGVAIVSEAMELRNAGIKEPILVLGSITENNIHHIIENDITQTIFSYETAKKLSKIAEKLNKFANIHIKIDTGMSRLGFLPTNETIKEILKINELPFIKITGIFTHFSTSDEIDKSFSINQFDTFTEFTKKLEQNGISNIMKHISNSGAILDLPKYNLDMVRAGIIIYGLYPSEQVSKNIPLKPAMTIKTHISFIKEVDELSSISYGRTHTTRVKSKIATIPVGYADGYARNLSNRGRVIVNGQYAKIVGNICMDQFMIDVTHIDDINIGDFVTLIGDGISVEEVAKLQNTINYEVVCCIGKRVPRIYIH